MGEGKILLLMVLALVVLGPEKLPKLAADIGRWVGRARSMARQLTSQLEQEVHVEQLLKEQRATASNPPTGPADVPRPAASESVTPDAAAPSVASAVPPALDPPAVREDPTFSHAHGPGELAPDYALQPPPGPAEPAPAAAGASVTESAAEVPARPATRPLATQDG